MKHDPESVVRDVVEVGEGGVHDAGSQTVYGTEILLEAQADAAQDVETGERNHS